MSRVVGIENGYFETKISVMEVSMWYMLGSPKEDHTRTRGLSKVYCSRMTAWLS